MKQKSHVLTFAIAIYALRLSLSTLAQDQVKLDKSKIPASGRAPADFVPKGWKIEQELTGDLNGDNLPDSVVKLIAEKATDESQPRGLVILLMDKDGGLKNGGATDNLLQCVGCAGSFPEGGADVSIEKGVIVINQEGGGWDRYNETYRFRFEPASGKFRLIGFDYMALNTRTTNSDSESTNYLTGGRVTSRGRGKKDAESKSQAKVATIYIDDADRDKLTGAVLKRLGLN